jgi:hypothetical protein
MIERDAATVREQHPSPRRKYLVNRNDTGPFVATPCYGMHEPWWVPLTADLFAPGSCTIPMQETDEWSTWKT